MILKWVLVPTPYESLKYLFTDEHIVALWTFCVSLICVLCFSNAQSATDVIVVVFEMVVMMIVGIWVCFWFKWRMQLVTQYAIESHICIQTINVCMICGNPKRERNIYECSLRIVLGFIIAALQNLRFFGWCVECVHCKKWFSVMIYFVLTRINRMTQSVIIISKCSAL